MTDFELYRRFRKGDESAFETLYDKYSVRLYNFALRIVGNTDLAEDIFQETFIRLSRSDLEERAKLSTWLYRVAANLCYKALRRKKVLGLSEIHLRNAADSFDPSAASELLLLQDRVRGALMKLPDNQRVVLTLKFWEEMTYAEIAEILMCPPGTIKSRTHNALKRLKETLGGESN
jgi:RNA polymerase sigma-70 factor (ECF subfamily)